MMTKEEFRKEISEATSNLKDAYNQLELVLNQSEDIKEEFSNRLRIVIDKNRRLTELVNMFIKYYK